MLNEKIEIYDFISNILVDSKCSRSLCEYVTFETIPSTQFWAEAPPPPKTGWNIYYCHDPARKRRKKEKNVLEHFWNNVEQSVPPTFLFDLPKVMRIALNGTH